MELVADNIRITKSDIQKALDRRDPAPVRELAQRCAAAGAHAIDINTGPLKKNPKSSITFFVRAVGISRPDHGRSLQSDLMVRGEIFSWAGVD